MSQTAFFSVWLQHRHMSARFADIAQKGGFINNAVYANTTAVVGCVQTAALIKLDQSGAASETPLDPSEKLRWMSFFNHLWKCEAFEM